MKAQYLTRTERFVSNEKERYVADELNAESFADLVAGTCRDGLKVGGLIEMAFAQAPQFIVVCDLKGKIVLASTGAQQMARVTPAEKHLELWPRIWGDLFDTNGRCIPADEWPSIRALGGEVTLQREFQLVQPGGLSWDILFSAAPVTMHKQITGAVAVISDVTIQKQAERMLLKEGIRRERSKIAADIHDTFAQSLNAIVLQLQAVEHELAHDRAMARQHLLSAQTFTRETLAEARRSIWTLSHEALENEELGRALSFLAKQLFTATPVEVQLSLEKEPCPLLPEVRLELLRLGREAMANVLKHARATKIHIRLEYRRREMLLCVDDNGLGFELSHSSSTNGGFGLTSMRRRTAFLGGRLVIDTQPGNGTRIVAVIPIPVHGRSDTAA